MGSRCTIVVYGEDEVEAALGAKLAFEEIARVNDALSDYDPNSEAIRLCETSGKWVEVSDILMEVLVACERFYELSDGAFDPTVGVFTHLWRAARREGRIPTQQELARARESFGFSNVELDVDGGKVRLLKEGMVLDFGGIGKGYGCDRAMSALRERGLGRSLVNLGGDLVVGDIGEGEGWEVRFETGVDEPWTEALSGVGVATSGAKMRFFEHDGVKYSHIVDPRTGMGLRVARGVSVVGPDGLSADAIASVVSVLGEGCIGEVKEAINGVRVYVQERE